MITSPQNQTGGNATATPKTSFFRSPRRAFKESWKRISASRPGRRFQDRYAFRKSMRRQRARRLMRSNWLRRFDLARFLYLGGGLILIALSTVGGWLPVLGWGTVFLGLGLIAGEFKPAAILMDWLEKWGRRTFRPVWHLYLKLPRWLQVIIPIVVALATFALMATIFHVTFLGG